MRKIIFAGMLLVSMNAQAFNFDFPSGGFPDNSRPKQEQEEQEQNMKVPDWVINLRNGAGIRVSNGNHLLFRNITLGRGEQRDLCGQSQADNRRTITDMFPLIKNVPGIELRHVYFQKGLCATTISIKRKIFDLLEKISLKKLQE